MIKEAIQYLMEKREPAILSAPNGRQYTDVKLEPLMPPTTGRVAPKVSTLSGMVDYINQNIDGIELKNTMLHIESPTSVILMSKLLEPWLQRNIFIMAQCEVPSIRLSNFNDLETFNVMLQSLFVPSEVVSNILRVTGNIAEENIRTTVDDGISQAVTVKQGRAGIGEVIIKNPVMLAPYRTFPEILQPESSFILRMRPEKEAPTCGLFEADGGRWKVVAHNRIKDYFAGIFPELAILS